jgi:probable HAF family extracellular repeat protein
MLNRVPCRAVSVLSLIAATGALADTTMFTGLGDIAPGSNNSRAQAISADGTTITGRCTPSNQQRVFRWTGPGGMVNLGGPNLAIGTGISGDGSVIVGYNATTSGDAQAFRWTSSGFVSLLALGSQSPGPRAFGVSTNGGVAVGESNTSFTAVAVLWPPTGTPQPLSNEPEFTYSSAAAVSGDGTIVVGRGSSPAVGTVGFRWTASGGMTILNDLSGGATTAAANAISADGSTIVGFGTSDAGQEATVWSGATPTGLGDLSGGVFESNALAVSADGSVIVGYSISDAGEEAFMWDAAHGMRSIRSELVGMGSVSVTGWTLSQATGISADGHSIVGYGINPNGEPEAWLARFPAPCYVNCDHSTAQPVLNAQDFLCFLNLYASEDAAANCDHSTAPPTLNVLDFMCFINMFAAGCP